MKKRLISLILVLMLLVTMVAGCGNGAEVPAPDVDDPGSNDVGSNDAEHLTGFSEETVRYLEGKDFSGQTLVVGVWGGDYEAIIREVVIPPLEAMGAKVELLLGGAGDRVARLYAEQGNPSMDIAYINIHTAAQAAVDGVVEYADTNLPAYNDLYDFATSSGGYGAAVSVVGIQYNKNVFPTAPSWADVFNAEQKGKISFSPWPSTGTDAILGVVGRLVGGTEHDTDQILAKMQEIKPVPLLFTSNDELAEYMNQGLVNAALNLGAYAQVLADQHEDIEFVVPQDIGGVIAMDVLCITEGSKNRDLALAYTQLALDPKTQVQFAERTYFGPTNRTVVLDEEVASKVPYGPEEIANLIELDWPYIVEIRVTLAERWNQEVVEGN